jgi:hypothetical protein
MPNHSSKPKRPRDANELAKFLVDSSTDQILTNTVPESETVQAEPETPIDPLRAATAELGRGGLKGGRARAKKLTVEQRSEISKKAAVKR